MSKTRHHSGDAIAKGREAVAEIVHVGVVLSCEVAVMLARSWVVVDLMAWSRS
jgi:hypothetical protein